MSKIDDGGPAFASTITIAAGSNDPYTGEKAVANERRYLFAGMSLRDYFAGQALAGMLADTTTHVGFISSNGTGWPKAEGKFRAAVAECAYAHADAMLAARKVHP